MPTAYAAARTALLDELTRIVPRVLDFREGESIIPGVLGSETSLAIKTERSPPSGLPLIAIPDLDYRSKGPGSAIQQLHGALRMLVRDRMWLESEAPCPPVGLFKTNNLTNLLCLAERVDPQDLLVMVWEPLDIYDGWSAANDWQSGLPMPEVLKQSPVAQRQIRYMPDLLPWVSGYIMADEIAIDAMALLPDGALYRLTRFGPTELRLPADDGTDLQALADGQPVGDIAWDGVPLRNFNRVLVDDLRYAGSLSVYKRSIRLMTEGEWLWEKTYFSGHQQDEVRAEFNKRVRQLFLKRARIEATIVRHLQEFASPAEDIRKRHSRPDDDPAE